MGGGGGGWSWYKCQLSVKFLTHRENKRGSRGRKAGEDAGASERIISHMSMRRSRHFMAAADDWVHSKVAITN